MRKIIFGLLACWTSFAAAQSLTGTLQNENNEAVPFAAVMLLSMKDSTLVKATTSDEQGRFVFLKPAPDSYVLRVRNLGYATYETNVLFGSRNEDLGVIRLKAGSEELENVTVTAEKPMVQVLADKTVFNVENTINATGTSAFELLRKAPGVIVDNNGGFIVEGKTGVQFFIDGKLSVLQGDDLISYLESLQATDIESVEIITQPSSKYDAAGNAGIINLVLKKDKSLGTNGTVVSGVTAGDYGRNNTSVSFNSRGRSTNLYGTYSNRFGKNTSFINLLRQQSGTQFDARTESLIDRNSNNLKLGFDLYSSERSTFGLMFDGNFNNNYVDSDSRTPIRPIGNPQIDSVLIANNRTSNTSSNINGNLNYRYKDTLGYMVNIDLDYGRYSSDREAFQPNFYFDGNEAVIISQQITQQITPIDIDIATLKGDYEQNLLKGTLGLGVKYSYVDTDNVFDFFNEIGNSFVLDMEQSNQFKYSEEIYAAYFNYNKRWKKWNVQFGVRMENTVSDGRLFSAQENIDDQVTRNYVDFFPSGGLTYQLNRKNQFALTYSRRIQRPNYASLNPFEYKIDELSFSKGNPFLQPQYTDNLKLSHTFNYRLTTSVSFSRVSDYFARVTVAEGDTRNFLTTLNVADQEVWNLGISYPKQLTDWWNIYFSLNAYTSRFIPTSPQFLAISQETLSFYIQNTINLPWKLRMEISGWYSSPSIWGGTYQTDALGSLNIAFQKKYMNDKLTARLAFNDVLFTSPWSGITQFGDLFIDGSGGSDSRQVAVSLSYNFGRDEIKKSRKRKTGLEDEKGRIDNGR